MFLPKQYNLKAGIPELIMSYIPTGLHVKLAKMFCTCIYDFFKKNEKFRACVMYGGRKTCIQGLVRRPEGRSLERSRRRIILN